MTSLLKDIAARARRHLEGGAREAASRAYGLAARVEARLLSEDAALGRSLGRIGRRIGGRGPLAGAAIVLALAVAVAGLGLAVAGGGAGLPRLMRAPGSSAASAKPLVVGYFENGWSRDFDDSFPSLRGHPGLIDTVYANWYGVGGDGAIARDEARQNVITFAKEHGVRMGILVTNVKGDGPSRVAMLTDPAARSRAVASVAEVVRARGYEAVNVDFELIPPAANVGFTQFVCGLRRDLPKGVTLSAAVFPPAGVAREINGAYDYRALADCTDYLVVMLYDYHYRGSQPGPLSPGPWVSGNVDWLLEHGIAPSKVVLAAGLYGIDWDISGAGGDAEERPLDGILGLAADVGARPRWSMAADNPYFYYTDDRGRRHVVWYQDWRTLRARLDLVEKRGLLGVALWRLGFGVPHVWRVLDDAR